jgi:hypothetical protein
MGSVLKAELAAVLKRRIKARKLGLLLIDSTRVVCEAAEPLGCGYRLDSREGPLGGQDFDLVEV